MDNPTTLTICLYSDANFLAVNILENLLSQKCFVNIISNDVKKWTERTVYIANKNRFNISKTEGQAFSNNYNYVIYCGGFIKTQNTYEDLKIIQKQNNNANTKILAILPFECFDPKANSQLIVNDNLAVIYLGDLLGPRMDLDSDLLVPQSLGEILQRRTLTLGVGEIFYPVFVTDVVKIISKWLFSFGPYGKEIFVLGPEVSGTTFWQENEKLVSAINLKYSNGIETRVVPRGYEIKTVPINLKFALTETYKWLSSSSNSLVSVSDKRKTVRPEKPLKIRKVRVYPKFLKPLILCISLVLLFPIFSFSVSSAFFFFSYTNIISGNADKAETNLLVAKTFSVLTKQESRVLTYIPLFGRLYRESYFAGELGSAAADISLNAIPLVKTSSDVFNKVLGNDIYDPTQDSKNIKTELDLFYRNVSNIEAATIEESSRGTLLANKVLGTIHFDKVKNLAIQGQKFAENLPNILGVAKRKTYLVLFENNMELRPTGGFIGSYGLMTFDGGRMSDLTVNDVYSADGQLNGHVEPPTPIKDYLGEANWWLRDSNWDPDFPTSAKRAEWFLDKEVGKQVDGVISVDLFPIKEILKSTGPIFLPDFNLSLDNNNLYEKTQSEVQDNFFPGTRKKASFLTALSRSLLSEVGKVEGTKKSLILKSFFESFEGRHLQVFLHDEELQKSLNSLIWDGSVINPSCGVNCYADLVGLVEANVGVNKANYFVTRNLELKLKTTPSKIDRTLTLTLKNSANPSLGPSGRYKVYLRLLMPDDAELTSVRAVSSGVEQELSPEITEAKGRREVGVLIEVLGGTSKDVVFDWETVNATGQNWKSYGLYFRKQAGVDVDPLRIVLESGEYQIKTLPTFTLTRQGAYVYNTTLSQDFFSRFTWR